MVAEGWGRCSHVGRTLGHDTDRKEIHRRGRSIRSLPANPGKVGFELSQSVQSITKDVMTQLPLFTETSLSLTASLPRKNRLSPVFQVPDTRVSLGFLLLRLAHRRVFPFLFPRSTGTEWVFRTNGTSGQDGVHRTVTQNLVFPFIDDIAFLGRKGRTGDPDDILGEEDLAPLIFGNEQVCAMRRDRMTAKILDSMHGHGALLSEERILAATTAPLYNTYEFWQLPSVPAVARAIGTAVDRKVFEVRILITIRKQTEALLSRYVEDYVTFYSRIRKLKTFDSFLDDVLSNPTSFTRIGYDYAMTVQAFEDVFGDRVHVVPYETMLRDDSAFLKFFLDHFKSRCASEAFLPLQRVNPKSNKTGNLYVFLDTVKKRLLGGRRLGLHRRFNIELLRRIPFPWNSRPPVMTDAQRTAIHDLFTPSNRELDEKHQLNLKDFGYY